MAHNKILVVVSRTDTVEQPAVQRALALADTDGLGLELFRCVYDSNLENYPQMPREEDYFDFRDDLVRAESTGVEAID